MVMLGSGSAERQVTIVGGGSGDKTQAILDITGYYR
jgi:spermidine synthase